MKGLAGMVWERASGWVGGWEHIGMVVQGRIGYAKKFG